MNRLLVLLPAAALALSSAPVFAQDAPEGAYKDLWCGIAFISAMKDAPFSEEDVAAARAAGDTATEEQLGLIAQADMRDQFVAGGTGLVDKATLRKMIEPVLPSEAAEIRPQELAELIQRRRALPVDVRDPGSFSRYRIPSAVNVPADKVMERIDELRPRDGRVRVLYGRTTEDEGPMPQRYMVNVYRVIRTVPNLHRVFLFQKEWDIAPCRPGMTVGVAGAVAPR